MRVPLLLLVLAASGFAAQLQLDSASVTADKPATLNLRLQTESSELTGVQFDIEYDASRFDVTVEVGPDAVSAVKVLQSNTVQPGKQRVLIFGFNRNKLGDGVMALAHVALKSGAANGDAEQDSPVRISAQVGTNGAGETVALKATGGNIRRDRATAIPTRR